MVLNIMLIKRIHIIEALIVAEEAHRMRNLPMNIDLVKTEQWLVTH